MKIIDILLNNTQLKKKNAELATLFCKILSRLNKSREKKAKKKIKENKDNEEDFKVNTSVKYQFVC